MTEPISKTDDTQLQWVDGGCPCGRPTRYTLIRDGKMLSSCNKYMVCPTYAELEKAVDGWRSRACRAEHDLETLQKILTPK